MKRGTLALALIALGVVLLVVAGLLATLFAAAADQNASGVVALTMLGGGAALIVLGLVVRLTAPKPRPDNEYDHDLPNDN